MQLPLQLPQVLRKIRRRLSEGQQVLPVLSGQAPVRQGAETPGIVSGAAQKALQLFKLLRLKGQDRKGCLRRLGVGQSAGAEGLAQGVVRSEAELFEDRAQILRRAHRRLKGPGGLIARRKAHAPELP